MHDILNFLLSESSLGVGEFKLKGPLVVIVLVLGFAMASLVWVWDDAKQRNKNAFLAFLFVCLAGWPLSLIWWLWLRPARMDIQKSKKPVQSNSSRV
ncbi:MAG: hypothetical protein HC904_13605 [Blastochloris sp.]|nr:hypothetical protein [Blastochloris sp.]